MVPRSQHAVVAGRRRRFAPTRSGHALLLVAACLGFATRGAAAQARSLSAPPSSLPSTPPTTSGAQIAAPLAAGPMSPAPGNTGSSAAHRAEVRFADGMLDVHADNSSLNQILHAISRETGMGIVGGVADQRVFGDYGPALPSVVLATLLDGTGTNMLIRESGGGAPVQLVLTPRNGGPTPPDPNASRYDEDDDAADRDPQVMARARHMTGKRGFAPGTRKTPGGLQGLASAPADEPAGEGDKPATDSGSVPPGKTGYNVNGSSSNRTPTAAELPTTNSVPLDTLATPATTPASNGIVDTPNPPQAITPAASEPAPPPVIQEAPITPDTPVVSDTGAATSSVTSTPGDANTSAAGTAGSTGAGTDAATAPRTPEQIYQQLLQMQQQQQQQAPATPDSTPPQN